MHANIISKCLEKEHPTGKARSGMRDALVPPCGRSETRTKSCLLKLMAHLQKILPNAGLFHNICTKQFYR